MLSAMLIVGSFFNRSVSFLTNPQCVAGQGIIIPQVLLGAGRHVPDVPQHDYPQAMKLNFVTQPMYLFAICLMKLSVGCFLLRVAVKPFYRRTIISIMGQLAH